MSELPLKATLKAGPDYAAPWLTVDGADADDLTFKLNAVANGGLTEALVNAANTLKAVNAAAPIAAEVASPPAPAQPTGWGSSPAQAQPSWSQPQQQAPAQQGPRLHPEGKQCHCGQVLQYKDIFSRAKQKSFQFWECPQRTGKDSPHISEFAN